MKADFTVNLMRWDREENARQMPWKGEKDPYRIWLSEIILQQTRVEQGLAYYERFISTFPDVHTLANAEESAVFKLWEGLGYYTRCKNLIHAARYVSQTLNGIFPSSYLDILKLKGVGPYTAAAISSFAFSEKRAVVDGNVQRVIARYFGISTAIDSTAGKQIFAEIADDLIDCDEPARFNQAIMDFGATICKPRNPLCTICVQHHDCEAYQHGFVDQLPVKEKQLKKRERWMNYIILRNNGAVFIRKRDKADIWQNLHEFVLFESQQAIKDPEAEILSHLLQKYSYSIAHIHHARPQQLTHQKIRGSFYVIDLPHPIQLDDYTLTSRDNLHEYAFPRFINSFLEQYAI